MIHVALLFLLSLSPALPRLSAAKTELQDHRRLNESIRGICATYPDLARPIPIGTSRGGREVLALHISSPKKIPAPPAILLVAGLDGPRAYTSSMALAHARSIAEGYGNDEAITQFLDTTALYLVPRADVDAAEARFHSPLAEVLGTGRGVDNDRDGRFGEDAPADLNGDGLITSMRVLDPDGKMIEDPVDPRILVEADRSRGERGKWKLYTEGNDSDGDEQVAEDPVEDAVFNRNFPRNREEHAPSAGLFATDEPVVRGLLDFVLTHPDIALVVNYGDEGNLVKAPESQDDDGPSSRGSVVLGVYESDSPLYEELGRRYRELTGNENEGLGEQHGSFQGWAYHHRGLLSLDIDPWAVPLESEESTEEGEVKPEPSDAARRLAWLEAEGVKNAFIPWTPIEHPQLGMVEIGGFRPYVLVEPPGKLLAELTETHGRFLLSLGEILPRLQLIDAEAKELAKGLFEITAVLENGSLLPLQTHAARRSRSVRPARIRLELPDGAELLGGRHQELIRELEGAGGRHELRWLVGGVADPGAIRILLDTDHAGRAGVIPEVN
jgi:hypothetical protein